MIEKTLISLSKSKLSQKLNSNLLLEEIPESYFKEYYGVKRRDLNGAIVTFSLFLSLIISFGVFFYDIIFGILVLIIIFLTSLLLFLRKIKKNFLLKKIEVEQFSDFICREMLLVMLSSKSLSMAIEYLALGTYPIISSMLKEIVKKTNIGYSPLLLIEEFAHQQPSETIREFILNVIIPLNEGRIDFDRKIGFETQWRIRQSFEAYLSQLEGKTSIFLSITTIIPITISMLLVFLGYINLNLLLFLPLIFIVFDLIAIEIYNTGKINLMGGKLNCL